VPTIERDSTAVHNPGKKWSPALLLACAGCVVIAAAFSSQLLSNAAAAEAYRPRAFEARLLILLGTLSLATALATAALVRPASGNLSQDRVEDAGKFFGLAFALLVVVHLLLAFLIVRPGTVPHIDVYTFQKHACENLLRGIDPFGATQADIYDARDSSLYYAPGLVIGGRVLEGFQYTPLTLFWALPGYLLGDVRISYIFAVIVSAWILFALCPDYRGLGIASVLLLSPLTFMVEYNCFTEPLVYMTLCATVYAAVKKRWWLPIALGLFLASKQYNFWALPLIASLLHSFQWKTYWKLAGLSLATAATTILPFAVWNAGALWHDAVLFHLSQPYRLDSLSFAVPLPWIMKVGPLLVLAFVVWAARAGNRSAATFPAAYGVVLLLFFLTSKQAFPNYYFLAGQAFFLAVVALHPTRLGQKVQLL
jgi:hypothetical protein